MPVLGGTVFEDVTMVKDTLSSPTPPSAEETLGGDFQSPLARWLAEPITFELADAGDDTCAWTAVPARLPTAECDVLSAQLCPPVPAACFSMVPVPVVVDASGLNCLWMCAPYGAVPVAPVDAIVHSSSVSTCASSSQSVTADASSDVCEPLVEMPCAAPKLSASAARRRRRQKAAAYAAAAAAAAVEPRFDFDCETQQTRTEPALFNQQRCRELSAQLARGGDSLSEALCDIRGSVLSLSTDSAGCRLVQDALESADHCEAASLALELRGHVWATIASPHGNYVVQKMIEVLPASLVVFVAEELRGYAVETARHRYGCRVLCRLLEHSASEPATVALVEEVLTQAAVLSSHEYGHYVVESVLEHGSASQASCVARDLRPDLSLHCQDRNATYVVKAALAHSAADCQSLADELIADSEQLQLLAEHRYGYHVVLALLRSPSRASSSAQQALRPLVPQLRLSVFGSRVVEEVR